LVGGSGGVTKGGCIVCEDAQYDLLIYREPAALLGRADGAGGFDPVPVAPGETHLYDRRFIVRVPADLDAGMGVPQTQLLPLGTLLPRDIATSTLDRQRISTLPCLARDGRLTHLPATCDGFVRKALSAWSGAAEFLSSVGLCEAESLLEERFTGRVIRF
jgi:hypothetical protein